MLLLGLIRSCCNPWSQVLLDVQEVREKLINPQFISAQQESCLCEKKRNHTKRSGTKEAC